MPRGKPRVSALTAVDCVSYRPGHHVHAIQALRTANQRHVRAKSWWGRIVELGQEGLVVERADGTQVRLLNHHMERLITVAGGLGARVLVNDRYAILRCGNYCFSVRMDDDGQAPMDACVGTGQPRAGRKSAAGAG
jgi:hypothetical protein